ncbi:hypothetical protein JTE90_015710 [Oedothorax gibbosus]|uniref:Uncharacterized protein n=1 Tax=Oedothorax gibbosus TaxID=931172 RepID=A0AAV6TP45_9ARAC|nr:hypothetical protein JTE90_015710 [Oedothorax gibbosus]
MKKLLHSCACVRLSQGPIGEGSAGAAAAAVYYLRPVVYVLTCLYPNGVLLRFYFGIKKDSSCVALV